MFRAMDAACSAIAGRIRTRFVIGLMIFWATTFGYMLSFNFSINLLAMVRPANTTTNQTVPDFGPRFGWSPYEQSLLLGAYFYGNVLTVPAGLLVERFGHARSVIVASFGLGTVLTALGPLSAHRTGFPGMFALRFGLGLAQGLLYPAYTKLIALWSPPDELGLFTSTLMGSNIGTVLAWCLSSAIVESYGWPASFYANAALAAVFTAACVRWLHDSPARHPRIASAERAAIEKSLQAAAHGHQGPTSAAAAKRSWPPLRAILSSRPCWALFWMQFGNSWGSFFLVTAAPKFLNEILGFDIGRTGLLASLPYVLRTAVAFGFAALARRVEMRANALGWSTTSWRRIYSVFSHVLPGLLLLAIPYAAENAGPFACVALIAASYGLNGAVTVVCTTNYHDLSPRYATTLNALINGVGNAAGFLSPLVVAFCTQSANTMAEWRTVFGVGAAVYLVPAVLFAVAGSAEVQPWNDAEDEQCANGARRSTVEKYTAFDEQRRNGTLP